MKSIKIAALLIAVALLLGLGAQPVEASKECTKQYGGGEICIPKKPGLKVHKQVKNPKTGDYEDSISPKGGSNPYLFKSGDSVKFRIVVENTGDIEIENIDLEDILPTFVRYRDGDGDGKDDDTKVEFGEFDLDAGERKVFEFTAKIDSKGIKLTDKDYVRLTNIARAEGDVRGKDNEEKDSDYANFCAKFGGRVKGKEAPKSLPTTGGLAGEELAKALVGSFSTGLVLVGYGLRKLSA